MYKKAIALIDMPTNCFVCPLWDHVTGWCGALERDVSVDGIDPKRYEECPLVPIDDRCTVQITRVVKPDYVEVDVEK